MPSSTIAKRLFIVGSSRSGTTLLQVSVGAHPRIRSFPETFFFQELTRYLSWIPARLGAPTGRQHKAFARFLREIGRPDFANRRPSRWASMQATVDAFRSVLDDVTRASGCDIWLEKTPMHVHELPYIERYVPDAHIIHMIRDGRSVVASIHDRACKHPEKFGDQKNPLFGIGRWNYAMFDSVRCAGRPNHSFVFYEDLVRDTEAVLQRLCEEIGIAYRPVTCAAREESAQQAIPSWRTWIHNAAASPAPRASKFGRLFSRRQQRHHAITAGLALCPCTRKRCTSGMALKSRTILCPFPRCPAPNNAKACKDSTHGSAQRLVTG